MWNDTHRNKMPVALPSGSRLLCFDAEKISPLVDELHVTHPEELTPEFEAACARLADAGSAGSQTVLLKGVNDSISP